MGEKHAYPFQCEGEDCPLCYLDEIIEQLHARIKELEDENEHQDAVITSVALIRLDLEAENRRLNDGGCRYNCRKRKEMCQSFAYHVCKHRKSLMTPTAKVLKDMYADWNKDQ